MTRMYYSKKAEMGIGTLIIFISLLLVAAIAAGVLIQTAGSLQEKSLTTGEQARRDVSSGFHVVDVSASDGRDGSVDVMKQIIKLSPGASAVHIDNLLLILSTRNVTSTLQYRGPGNTITAGSTGYNTFNAEEVGHLGRYLDNSGLVDDTPRVAIDVDLDLDGATDYVVVCRSGRPFCPGAYTNTYVQFNLSTAGLIYVRVVNPSGSPVNLNTIGLTLGNTLTPIGEYGYMTTSGTTNGGFQLTSGQLRVFIKPVTLEEDLDNDGADDSFVINNTHVIFHFSSKGNISTQLNAMSGVAYNTGYNLASGAQALDTVINLYDNASSVRFGTLNMSGTTSRAFYIDEDVTFHITPETVNDGFYAVEYVQTSKNYVEGEFKQGDVIRLYYETPRPLYEDEEVRVSIIPRTGKTTLTTFLMPNVIATSEIHLYP